MAGKTKDATIIAHLVVDDSVKAAEFYRDAFGGEILGIHKTPDGKVMHAEVNIGGARLMLADGVSYLVPGSWRTTRSGC